MNDSKYKVDFLQLVEKDDKPSQRVIVLSNFAEIKKAIRLGYTKKKIFDVLQKENVIACNYSYFSRILKKHLPPTPENSSKGLLTQRSEIIGNTNPFGEDDGDSLEDLI